ncbi:septal ring lytic transglycosylase RlpA family protein [Pusillimonas sp. CC-YST705]|uniref:Endolytic peptidoglycan transglycosylase RlpA n=1 Tax=Mesopusillimonas faecipullorum TaxID=2755040 RepID=A0ABS8CCF1_9BURK|nr:septal ring lytic transglycosylase RlpA family protein [Mesopusillimonas faecipullorum]MCB5363688.1 septal ring lytic transglycosylase RlpA family protein [Mesopusillimonas faecipullorum]
MSRCARLLACTLLATLLAACGTSSKKGAYYQDDGPGSDIPANIAAIPDAIPRIEPYARGNLRPYRVLGRSYTPISDSRPFKQEGVASWYGRKFHGQRTANGETYDMYAMTAAHPTLPLPSYARVTHLNNGRSVVVRVNDRGPFLHSRIIDLSYAAASKLGFVNHGSARVRVEAITHEEIRLAQRSGSTVAASAAPQPSNTALTSPQTMAVSLPADLQPTARSANEPVLARGTYIYLQFGAFNAADSAYGLAHHINAQLGSDESRTAQVQQANGLHRVRMGPYASRGDALDAAVRIQERTGQQATIALQ